MFLRRLSQYLNNNSIFPETKGAFYFGLNTLDFQADILTTEVSVSGFVFLNLLFKNAFWYT